MHVFCPSAQLLISGWLHYLPVTRADGRFLGWVHPEVCERYGIPGAPEEAWEAGGGGQFSVQLDKKGALVGECHLRAIHAFLPGRRAGPVRALSASCALAPPRSPQTCPRA